MYKKSVFIIILFIFYLFCFEINKDINNNDYIDNSNEFINETATKNEISNTDNKIISEFNYLNNVDDKTYSIIKEQHEKVNFKRIFSKGNTDKYDYYKKQFSKLLKNEALLIDKENGNNTFIKNYGVFADDAEDGIYDLNSYAYYFFDMDGDTMPELCIANNMNFIYVIKYDDKTDKFTVWTKYEYTYISLIGTRAIANRRNYIKLDQNGNFECESRFKVEGYTDYKSGEDIWCYMVTLPQYYNDNSQVQLEYKLKKFAFYNETENKYYFRVTEEQFSELEEIYYSPENKQPEENIESVTYTYKELFGNL